MRRNLTWVLAAPLLAILIAGCADQSSPGAVADPGPSTSHEASTLTVATHIGVGRHGVIFTEGALPEVKLVDTDGHRTSAHPDRRGTFTFTGLAPGRYRIEAALRPCDGNCGYLDAPTGQCHASLQVSGDVHATARWVIGKACHLTTV